jgi:hypothetical protein
MQRELTVLCSWQQWLCKRDTQCYVNIVDQIYFLEHMFRLYVELHFCNYILFMMELHMIK